MNSRKSITGLVVATLTLICVPVSYSVRSAVADEEKDDPAKACKSWSASEFKDYFYWNLNLKRNYVRMGFVQKTDFAKLGKVFSACKKEIHGLGLDACTQNMREYSRAMFNGAHLNTLPETPTSEVSSEEYAKRQAIPAMELPAELKNGLPDNWRELAQKKGWKVLQYDSQTVANENKFLGRILILIQGPGYDQWLSFTGPNANGDYHDTKERQIDMIAMDTKPPNKIHFAQYKRDEKGEHPVRFAKNRDFCYTCHASGMRNLVPLASSLRPPGAESEKMLKEFNAKMNAYPLPDWDGMVTPSAYGPPMGKRQGCVNCHDGSYRGALNAATNFGHIRHKVMVEKSMPPGMSKDASHDAEREELLKEMQRTYVVETKQWLMSPECLPPTGENKCDPDYSYGCVDLGRNPRSSSSTQGGAVVPLAPPKPAGGSDAKGAN